MKKIILFSCLVFSFFQVFSQPLTPLVDSIPMSDGRKLAADVYIPSTVSQAAVILIQTPYNRLGYRLGLPLGIVKNIDSSKYIIVVVDWRGFYGSAAAAHIGAPSLGNDGHSCVEWIAQQTWSNGKVGTWGPSALGRVQFQTAKTNPPHLVCICPLVAAPQYDYVEYYPNGVLRTEYVDQLDNLGFGLKPTLMAHQTHDAAWNYSESINNYPDSIRVPCFMIGGWYDHTIQFMLPFFNELQTQSPVNVRSQHKLLMGPWVHGGHGTAQVGSSLQGQLNYPNAVDVDDSLALLFFDYHLRNINNGWNNTAAVQYYQMGENTWNTNTSANFNATTINFYCYQNGDLQNTLANSSTDKLTYNYDPNNPSPTVGGATLRSDLNQGPYDQSVLVETRNDILKFTTPALTQNAVMKGEAVVHLKVSSDKMDTDFDVRLCDVYPDGKSMLINHGAFRMRCRNGLTAADTTHLQPNNIYDGVITLPASCITFLAGHKIRLDVSSSNYPAFNRNMNTAKAPYPNNSLDTLVNPVIAANTVYCSNAYASYISLPLMNYTVGIEKYNLVDEINLYPNPSSSELIFATYSNDNFETTIYSLIGNKVKSFLMNKSYLMNVKEFENGFYVAEFWNKTTQQKTNKSFEIFHSK
ncbi:MAG: hypothetical protein RL708_1244 [Bacteroidota bacterium]